LRRAPLESVNVRTRLMIIGDLVRRRGEERTWILPEDEKILRLLLADRDECIRVAAAAFLADADRDPVGFPILVAYLRQPIAQIFERELWCWLWGPVTQAFSRLNDDRAAWALGRARAYFGTLDERGLDESPRISPAEWESWWREHASEYPPQVDPDRIAVGPLTSSSSVSLPLLR